MDAHYHTQINNSQYSIECFPVHNPDKYQSFIELVKKYEKLGVKSINITCRAGNSEPTRNMVKLLREHTNMIIIPHIVAHKLTFKELDETLGEYYDLGIRNVFAIRGDLDKEALNSCTRPDFLYAVDLVKYISNWSSNFSIGVAGYPERHYQEPNFIQETKHLYKKIEAGASYIVTQLFFDNSDFYDFIARCKFFDIYVPVIPGITFIKDKEHAQKIAQMALGSKIPTKLLSEIYSGNNNIGPQWMEEQICDLIKSKTVDTIHFYVFNSLDPFYSIIKNSNASNTSKA